MIKHRVGYNMSKKVGEYKIFIKILGATAQCISCKPTI